MKKVVIVDDEKLAIEELKFLLKNYDQINIVGEATTYEGAIETINSLQPDIVFLDIQLRTATAFDILEKINTNAQIIFATAFDEYAVKAFEVNAMDYLLKPINPERLKLTMSKFFKTEERPNKSFAYNDKIVINHQNGYCIVPINEIKAITADGDYSFIHIGKNKKHIITKSLKEWASILPAENFVRIHRSTIINTAFIEKIEKWHSNTCKVYIKELEVALIMSQRHTSSFKKAYKP